MSTVAPLLPTSNETRQGDWGQPADEVSGIIDRNPLAAFAALSGFYLIAVLCLSWVKLLWLDELITLHIARLNSAKAIWHALASGADPNPPMIHLLVMWSRRLFGEHAWALRLPATLGYWIGMWALYQFLRQRVSATWALTGVVISMGMGGFQWSFESRSYAVFYGLAMLAVYCWSLTVEAASRTHRYVAAAVLAFALATGICTNYFAVLAFVPIAAAEATRTISRRHLESFVGAIRWYVWIAMGIGFTPILIFRSMIKRSVELYAPYAFNKVAVSAAAAGYTAMVEWPIYPLFGLAFLAMAVHLFRQMDLPTRNTLRPRWLGRLADRPMQPFRLLSPAEAAAVSALVAYPFLGLLMAEARGGMLSPRFVIPVCLGCSIAGVLFIFRTFGHLRSAGVVTLAIALGWFAVRGAYSGWIYEERKESFDRMLARVPPPDYPGQPMAISDALMILPVEFYGSPDLVKRLVYPVDFPVIMHDRGEASAEVNFFYSGSSVYKFRLMPLAELQKNTASYMILTSGQEWLVGDLIDHGYDVEPIPVETQTADTYGFYSPVTHARPVFFRATGDLFPTPDVAPTRFNDEDNLPNSGSTARYLKQ